MLQCVSLSMCSCLQEKICILAPRYGGSLIPFMEDALLDEIFLMFNLQGKILI